MRDDCPGNRTPWPLWLAAFTQHPVQCRLGCRTRPEFIPFLRLNTIPLRGHFIDPAISGQTFGPVLLSGSCEQPGVCVHTCSHVPRVFTSLGHTPRSGLAGSGGDSAAHPRLFAKPPELAPGRSGSTVAKAGPPRGYTGCKWSLTSQNGVPSLYPFILPEVNVQDPSQVPPGAWSLRALPVPASPNVGGSDGSARHAPVPPLTWARGPAGDDRPAR